MAKHFSFYAPLLFLVTSSALIVMVAGGQCKFRNGDCTADCNDRCTSAVSGSKGLCGPDIGGVQKCWCYFECEVKTCKENFVMSENCEEHKCTLACINKHPGKSAEGKCRSVPPNLLTIFCQCTYLCP
ncbi:hypothetical protein HN51_065777 [Arachis hypogaea]|uniref:uncharacterized protein LOC110270979 n=1 Tax=Arachis ipaensis TaxID=130454 RepID=UPI000A2B2087|nr:uncharacterized protein LOC110270979 [Arachis ipaensis]QHO07034.1 uncharacterized protein DS421_14g460090 [Arachis hypogaea]